MTYKQTKEIRAMAEKARIEKHLMATGDMVIKSPFKYFFKK
jgi:hypothetical protein